MVGITESRTDHLTGEGAGTLERPRVTPRLCFVGPMLGINPGWVNTQGEILAGLLARSGYPVRLTSHIPARLPRLADTLWSLIKWRNDVDLVIHQVFSGPAFFITDAASALGRRLNLPQIFVLHGGALPEFATSHSDWVRRVMSRAGRIVAPSGYLAAIFEEILQPSHAVRIIPNILAIEQYPYRRRLMARPRLLWMRTFHDIYNPQMAVEVLADLHQTHPEAVLTMAGQGKGLHATIVDKARHMGLSGAVRFPGFLEPADKVREFDAHDIFLNTNHVDNMPVSVLEAGAFGLPVVATKVGGLPHLLKDGETGLLVADSDVKGMVDAVRMLLDDPDLVARLSSNGRALAESCSWEQVKTLWEALFQEVVCA
jgi:L-malate glycosyltransferase